MIPGSLAKRYARALVELAPTPMQRDRFSKDLEGLAEAMSQPVDGGGNLGKLLDAGHISLAKRKGIADAVAKRVGVDPMVGKFVSLLVERGRIGGMVLIARHFRDMADEAAGRVRATVKSAKPLAPDAVSKIKTALGKATGKQVLLESEVDPSLIGGLVTTVGSYTLDRSVRASIARLRHNLHDPA